jgi:hypothetical protein
MYPGHFVVMVYHKMMQALDGDLWPGSPTQLQVFVFGIVPRYWIVLSMLTIVALCVAVGHQRERTLLLAWPLFLDAPLFWIMFASLGRFYSAAGIGLLAAAVPPLFERSFYGRLAVRPWRTLSVLTWVCSRSQRGRSTTGCCGMRVSLLDAVSRSVHFDVERLQVIADPARVRDAMVQGCRQDTSSRRACPCSNCGTM